MDEEAAEDKSFGNADWMATCAIYGIESGGTIKCNCGQSSYSDDVLCDGGACGGCGGNGDCCWRAALQLSIQVRGTVFIQGPIHRPPAKVKTQQPNRYKHLLPPASNKPKKRRFQNRVHDPIFPYKILVEGEHTPVVSVEFAYRKQEKKHHHDSSNDSQDDLGDDRGPVSVRISPSYFPDFWTSFERHWLDWLNKKANKVLMEVESSFAVCQWIEYQSFGFFDIVSKNEHEIDPVIMVVSLLKQDMNDHSFLENMKRLEELPFKHWRLSEQFQYAAAKNRQVTMPFERASTFERSNNQPNNALECAVNGFISAHWKEWVTIECPICYDVIPVCEAKELFPCRHYYCWDCISMYSKTIVTELRAQRCNPFICPLPTCRRDIKIVQCIKALLTAEEMDTVREWYKNITNPLSNILQMCPRKKCGVRDKMRRVNMDSSIVCCGECGIHWCELCLARVPCKTKGSNKHIKNMKYDGLVHELAECDPSQVLQVCHRYRETKSEKIKERCEERWPWIREYAIARVQDVEAMQWIRENGCTLCPTCKTLIERTEGRLTF